MFDDFDTQVTCEEYYADDTSYEYEGEDDYSYVADNDYFDDVPF